MHTDASSARKMDRKRIALLGLLLLVAAYAHNLFHEFGHWLVGTILGNQMSMSLDGTWPTSGGYHQEWHSPAVGIGGPAFSILMALIAFIFVEKRRTVFAFPFLFFPLFSRLFALTLGGFAAQDEAGISASLEFGKYTAAIIVCSILLALVWKGSLTLKFGFIAINGWILGSTVCMLMVINTHKLFR
ncbi:MAG: hypothetical protein ABSC03_08430 [Verrucomicrobiota bacterium]|jgi:hypothetical protein